MVEDDLGRIERWLQLPHVARWWTTDTTAGAELERYLARILGQDARTTMLVVEVDHVAIGWCQWYRWEHYPDEAAAMGAHLGEVGIDYAIGEPTRVGRGTGTVLVAALVAEARRRVPGCGVLVDPDVDNPASRAVLERNGFSLVAVLEVVTARGPASRAIYRLAAPGSPRGA
jgi:aminoglycoside 6'-N-acetyltransferase